MTVSEAKARIEGYLNNYKDALSSDGLSVSVSCELLTKDFEDCDENSRKLAFICGEVKLAPEGAGDDEAMIYAMLIDAKRGHDISDELISSEINDFSLEMSRVLTGLHSSASAADFIKDEIRESSSEDEEAVREFEIGLNRFTRNIFIFGVCAVVVIASVAALLAHIL
ncbi:MAG: hypothetical protein J6C39_00835 [Clostridia bacterium]|nr:hypothetical protein [Clostridia bacterium]